MPCDLLPWQEEFIIGNMRKEKLEKIWHYSDSPLLKRFRYGFEIRGRCQRCLFVDFCRCGCRAIVYGLTGSLEESNPICLICEYIKSGATFDHVDYLSDWEGVC